MRKLMMRGYDEEPCQVHSERFSGYSSLGDGSRRRTSRRFVLYVRAHADVVIINEFKNEVSAFTCPSMLKIPGSLWTVN